MPGAKYPPGMNGSWTPSGKSDRGPSFPEIMEHVSQARLIEFGNKVQINMMAEFLLDLPPSIDRGALARLKKDEWTFPDVESEWFTALFGMADPWKDWGEIGQTIYASHSPT